MQPVPAPGAGGVAAVFAELNRGEEVTKGLRKVDKSEMTHKNPALRAGNVVPSSPISGGRRLLFYNQNSDSQCFSSNKKTDKTRETCCVNGKEALQVRAGR